MTIYCFFLLFDVFPNECDIYWEGKRQTKRRPDTIDQLYFVVELELVSDTPEYDSCSQLPLYGIVYIWVDVFFGALLFVRLLALDTNHVLSHCHCQPFFSFFLFFLCVFICLYVLLFFHCQTGFVPNRMLRMGHSFHVNRTNELEGVSQFCDNQH